MRSIRTLVCCGVVAAFVISTMGPVVLGALESPQSVQGPLERQAKPITPENPIPRRVAFEAPDYPADVAAAGARGTVTLVVTIDESGRVVEVRRTRLQLTAANPPVSLSLSGVASADEARFLVNQSPEHSDTIRVVLNSMTEAASRAVMLWRYDQPASAPLAFPVSVSIVPAGETGTDPATMIVASELRPGIGGVPLRVGGTVHPPAKVRHVSPAYPIDALAQRVTGLVIIEATIGRDGRVTDAKILRSIPMLDQAAIDAVMQWEFTPTLLNGAPVPVIMTVTVNFSLK